MAYAWPVTLSEAKAQLGKTVTVDDAEMVGFIDATTAVVEYFTGPITAATYTDVWDLAGASKIFLRNAPVISVTTVTEYRGSAVYTLTNQPVGSATDAYGYSVDDLTHGMLTRRSVASVQVPFGPLVKVTYSAGYAAVPANVRMAALELIQINWTGTQNIPRRTPSTDDGTYVLGWFVPGRVEQMLLPNQRMPGIA